MSATQRSLVCFGGRDDGVTIHSPALLHLQMKTKYFGHSLQTLRKTHPDCLNPRPIGGTLSVCTAFATDAPPHTPWEIQSKQNLSSKTNAEFNRVTETVFVRCDAQKVGRRVDMRIKYFVSHQRLREMCFFF